MRTFLLLFIIGAFFLSAQPAPHTRIDLREISPSGGSASQVPVLSGSPLAWHPATVSGLAGITALTGDVTGTGPGSTAATLATVNSGPGTCGDVTHVCQVTVNGKGLTTSTSAISIGPVAATFSAAATTGTLTHNFSSITHVVQCVDAGGFQVFPSSVTLGSNADTIGFVGGLTASTVCVAAR